MLGCISKTSCCLFNVNRRHAGPRLGRADVAVLALEVLAEGFEPRFRLVCEQRLLDCGVVFQSDEEVCLPVHANIDEDAVGLCRERLVPLEGLDDEHALTDGEAAPGRETPVILPNGLDVE